MRVQMSFDDFLERISWAMVIIVFLFVVRIAYLILTK